MNVNLWTIVILSSLWFVVFVTRFYFWILFWRRRFKITILHGIFLQMLCYVGKWNNESLAFTEDVLLFAQNFQMSWRLIPSYLNHCARFKFFRFLFCSICSRFEVQKVYNLFIHLDTLNRWKVGNQRQKLSDSIHLQWFLSKNISEWKQKLSSASFLYKVLIVLLFNESFKLIP